MTAYKYPHGYCGMPCALCTRYRIDGKSRCAGCSHGGYYTEPCKVHHCCMEKGLAQCGLCGEFPCKRLGRMGDFSDLNTGHAKARISKRIAEEGFERWYEEYAERADTLTAALERYNNGRMKRYICELFIREDIEGLRELMHRAEALRGAPKEKGAGFKNIAREIFGE